MSLNYGAVCESCECHPTTFHHSFSVSCIRCLPPTRELERCATCKAVFYCVCPITGKCSISTSLLVECILSKTAPQSPYPRVQRQCKNIAFRRGSWLLCQG